LEEKTAVTPDQAWALLKGAAGHRLEALFVLAVNSGLRQGELFGLQWRDVDLTEKQVRVRHSLEELDGKLRLKEPKSDKSRRTVDLPASASEALAGHRKRMLAEGHYAPDQPVFCDTDGGWLRKSNFIRRVYAPLLTKAKIEGVPFHGWRHFHASYHIELGTNVKVLQERLGHADVSTTMRFYVHTRDENHRHAADAFDVAFGKAKQMRKGTKTSEVG
jgi:integrase